MGYLIYNSKDGKLCKAGTIWQVWSDLPTARAAQNRIRDIYPETYIVDNDTLEVVE